MSNDCCNERPNFGHPACIEDLGNVTTFLFCSSAYDGYSADYQSLYAIRAEINNKTLIPFPQVENFVWTPAESQFEEASSGKKSWIKNGKISIACETWDGDATAKMIGKLQAMRCAGWGMYIITDSNNIIGRRVANNIIKPIVLDEQSIDALFQFKTDATTQKIMFSFDLARNFDVSTLYAMNGDTDFLNDDDDATEVVDWNDLPNVIDCELKVTTALTTTTASISVNDDYRQGARDITKAKGNVTGLVLANFEVTNVTDNSVVSLTSVTESATGIYDLVFPTQTTADLLKIELVNSVAKPLASSSIIYSGSLNATI